MAGPNRRKYLMTIIEEYLEDGVGRHHWGEIVDRMLAEGHTTLDEIANSYGRAGFYRALIRPVAKKRDAAGRDRFIPTKSGGWTQLEFPSFDDLVVTYWKRKHHIAATSIRLQKLREFIIDNHDVDPETLPDPTGPDVTQDDEHDDE